MEPFRERHDIPGFIPRDRIRDIIRCINDIQEALPEPLRRRGNDFFGNLIRIVRQTNVGYWHVETLSTVDDPDHIFPIQIIVQDQFDFWALAGIVHMAAPAVHNLTHLLRSLGVTVTRVDVTETQAEHRSTMRRDVPGNLLLRHPNYQGIAVQEDIGTNHGFPYPGPPRLPVTATGIPVPRLVVPPILGRREREEDEDDDANGRPPTLRLRLD